MARLRSLLSSNWSTPYATEVLPGHVLPRRFGLYLEITGATEEGSVLLGDEEPALDSGGGGGGEPHGGRSLGVSALVPSGVQWGR